MRCWDRRDELKSVTMTDLTLTDAYRLLTEGKEKTAQAGITDLLQWDLEHASLMARLEVLKPRLVREDLTLADATFLSREGWRLVRQAERLTLEAEWNLGAALNQREAQIATGGAR
jgi:hypothetical protein